MSSVRGDWFGLRCAIFVFITFVLIPGCDPPRDSISTGSSGEAQIAETEAGAEPFMASSLPNSGDVILLGGWSKGNKSTATTEFFDQQTERFFRLGTMAVSEGAGAASLLTENVPNTEILVAGGFGGKSKFTHRGVRDTIKGSATNNLQILDPATGQFTAASSPLLRARFGATTTELISGKFLLRAAPIRLVHQPTLRKYSIRQQTRQLLRTTT